jgi:glycine betaine/choline ABC-type transport system substrate-binding protein
LEDLAEWSQGKAAAVPAMAIERADGLGALNAIYRTNFQALTQDDPVARAAAVASGQAAIGAFRRTEYLGGAALVELIDPDQMCISDQLILLVNAGYADASPQQTLAMNAVVQGLGTADVASLAGQVAQGKAVDQVAHDWLVSHQLG